MLNGSLYNHLRLRDMESLSWKKRLEICIGAAKGLHYLHTGAKRAIFHCDIKPQTILLDNSMVPKLSHLGFSLQGKLSKSNPKPIKVDILIGKLFSSIFRVKAQLSSRPLAEIIDCYLLLTHFYVLSLSNYRF
jgi:serine/threonine protein kinase